MKVICITGTPGTGKTTLARKLSKNLKYVYLDVNKVVSKYGLAEGYDKKRKTKIIDIKKLNQALIKEINSNKNQRAEGLIIDSHLSHYLPSRYADLCIVTRCDFKILARRLKNKGYNKAKIRENLDAEIFEVCLQEAIEKGHDVKIVDMSKTTKDVVFEHIRNLLKANV